MGKITVKHYLNTDIQSEQLCAYSISENNFVLEEKETLYPVYLLITVNRRTTKLRSLTGRVLCKSDFETYINSGTYCGEKKQCNKNLTYYLKSEIEYVTASLDYFYNKQQGNQEENPIKNVVNFYMRDFDSAFFLEYVNGETIFTIEDPRYEFIYNLFRLDVSPLAVVDFFTSQLNVDLYTLSNDDPIGDWGDMYKSVELFLHLMPKDEEGKVIGKMINWFDGALRNEFKKKLNQNKYDVTKYYEAFDELCKSWEKMNITQKFRFSK